MATTNSNTINLIHTKTGLSPQVELIDKSLKNASMIAIISFLLAGFASGALYYYYASNRSSLEVIRDQLRSQIHSVKNNEGFLMAIKERTNIVQKAINSQRPLAQTLKLLSLVAVPPILAGVSIDEESMINITLQADSIDEILPPIESLIAYSRKGMVKIPTLRSVEFDKNGVVTIMVSFNAVF